MMCLETPPWDDLDPGIRATVRALWDAGFRTVDSGDGAYKFTLPDYDTTQISDAPHVVIRPPTGELEATGARLYAWAHEQGWEDPGPDEDVRWFQVEAHVFTDPEMGVPAWALYLTGTALVPPVRGGERWTRGEVAEMQRHAAECTAGDDVLRLVLDPPEPTEDLRRIMRGKL